MSHFLTERFPTLTRHFAVLRASWAMQNEAFKVQLFRFVDVLPYLTTSDIMAMRMEFLIGRLMTP